MSSKTVYLDRGEILSSEDLNIDPSELELMPRSEEMIYDVEFKTEAISYSRDVWRRFRRDKVTVTATLFIIAIIIMAIIGPNINEFNYRQQNLTLQFMPPRIPGLENIGIFDGRWAMTVQYANLYRWENYLVEHVRNFEMPTRAGDVTMSEILVNLYAHRNAADIYHWFGTDILGRDLFTRLWQGTRVSLLMAAGVGLMTLVIGLIVGSICGYYGGWADMIIQRVMEVIWNIPQLPLIILLIMRFGSGISTMIIIFSITNWIGPAQGVRMQFYRFKNREYVLASRTMGASDFRIMFKYILPNAAGYLITALVLVIPSVVFQEAGLSYLGLGIQAPHPSIGSLLSDGQSFLLDYPFIIIPPAFVIVILMLAFNLFGNGLRDAFDPALRR